jgi:serine/threonine-protein kinase
VISIGSTVGNYEVIAKLGSGAMGSVFLAEHPSIGKRVALKVIHSDLASNAEMVSRFFTEARAVTQIANDHIIDVQNFGQTPDGDNFIVMEFLDGGSLGARLKAEHILSLDVAMHIAWQVADGLAASHSRGIIHRDLKPDNIFLITRSGDPCFVKILDFGLAKLTQGGGALSHKTQAGSVLGTPHYMAPEQCEGKPDIDHRVDVYALGCIMYEMLCGRVPFPGEGFGEVLVKHLREPPQMPTRLNPHITKAVEKIILHALAKKKEFRFASMEEFRAAIGDPESYSRALEGDRPINIGTMELLAQSPVRAEASTMMAQSPEPADGRTIVTEAPNLADFIAAGAMPAVSPSSTPTLQPTGPVPRSGSGGTVALVIILIMVLLGGGAAAAYFFVLKPKIEPLVVTSDPVGAQVYRDGQQLGKTPLVLQLPRGTGSIDLTFKKDGFFETKQSLTPGKDPAIVIKLHPKDDDLAPSKTVTLEPVVKVAAPPITDKKPVVKPPPTAKPLAPKPHPPAKPKKKEHFDDDVLEPSF